MISALLKVNSPAKIEFDILRNVFNWNPVIGIEKRLDDKFTGYFTVNQK